MVSQNSTAAVQQQMRDIRQDISEQADELVKKAHTQFDWRHYVARHPWVSLGAAAVVGFMLVPRRACCRAAERPTRRETVEHARQPLPPPAVSGLALGMATVLTTALAREGAGLLSHLAREWLEQRARPPQGVPCPKPLEGVSDHE